MQVSLVDGPYELKRDRIGNVVYAFSGGELGGILELTFNDEEWNDVNVAIQTK